MTTDVLSEKLIAFLEPFGVPTNSFQKIAYENEIAINDLVDIGIFTGEKKTEKVLFLEKRRITQPGMEFEITVDQLPTRAGIDPYNKLIDRAPDDNVMAITKAQ